VLPYCVAGSLAGSRDHVGYGSGGDGDGGGEGAGGGGCCW